MSAAEKSSSRPAAERGQMTILMVTIMGIFLLAFAGLATDYTRFWYVRQSVQGAADATCQAAATDLMLYAEHQQTAYMNFTPAVGTQIDCSSSSSAAPCIIAKYNGYDATVAGNRVILTFPSSVSNAPPRPPGVATPYVQVDVTKQAPTYLSSLLTHQRTVAVHAAATCGLTAPGGPVPILLLHPTTAYSINMDGTTDTITVVGGPQRSIQVNSSNPQAVTTGSLSAINLSKAGPYETGGDLGTFGGQPTAPGSVNLGSTGSWVYPAAPISDPYQSVSAPAKPSPPANPNGASVKYQVNGCPDPNGCTEYSAGYYASQLKVKNGTAIFDPGLYYLGGGLRLDANSVVRVSCCGGTADGDGSGGITFYFSGSSTLYIDANSGKHGRADVYYRDGGTHNGVQSRALQCPGGANNPPQVPATIDGNVLLAPCSGAYGDPTGQYRGFLYFQDRSAAASPQWQGGGTTLASGFMYFHQCRSDGTGLNCSAPSSGGYGTSFGLGGNASSGSYAIGSIVTDTMATNGNPGILLLLNPEKQFQQLKVVFLK
jgi:Flp pilus assembly protein TadG